MSDPPIPDRLDAALRHYDAMRRAQHKYYEKKMGPKDQRRPRGRPKKVAEDIKQEEFPTVGCL